MRKGWKLPHVIRRRILVILLLVQLVVTALPVAARQVRFLERQQEMARSVGIDPLVLELLHGAP
ncbi:MAG: hypothetical protein EA427_17085 [Spirochaetaceae bacterium]|nr:MAG: hypothetical protein EA427_17085 [Spirochaetaceae bacterium]